MRFIQDQGYHHRGRVDPVFQKAMRLAAQGLPPGKSSAMDEWDAEFRDWWERLVAFSDLAAEDQQSREGGPASAVRGVGRGRRPVTAVLHSPELARGDAARAAAMIRMHGWCQNDYENNDGQVVSGRGPV